MTAVLTFKLFQKLCTRTISWLFVGEDSYLGPDISNDRDLTITWQLTCRISAFSNRRLLIANGPLATLLVRYRLLVIQPVFFSSIIGFTLLGSVHSLRLLYVPLW